MTYSQFIPTNKVIDTKRSPRAPINFVNTQISKNFTVTIDDTAAQTHQAKFEVDTTYEGFSGFILLQEKNLNSGVAAENNQWEVSLKKNDIPFVVVASHTIAALNKDNFGLAILDVDPDDNEKFAIKLYAREGLIPGNTITITSVLLFERYEEPDTVFEPIVGITNGGGSGSGSSGEWSYDETELNVFVQYFNALINQIDQEQDDIQDILDNLSERIATGQLEASLVSAGTVSADRLIIEGNNIITEFDSFEEWGNKTVTNFVPPYIDNTVQATNLVVEYNELTNPKADEILGKFVWSIQTPTQAGVDQPFPTININNDYYSLGLPDVNIADYYTYYLIDDNGTDRYYLKRKSYKLTSYRYESLTSSLPIEGEPSVIYYTVVDNKYYTWNDTLLNYEELASNNLDVYLSKNAFPITGVEGVLYRSRKTNLFYEYQNFEEVAAPSASYSLRLTPRRFLTTLGSRLYGLPWINLSPGRYVLSYYIRTTNTDINIEPSANLSLVDINERNIISLGKNNITNSWEGQRLEQTFTITEENIDNLFYLEFNFYTTGITYYIDGIQLEQYPLDLSGYDEQPELVATPFSRGGKILFDGSNLKAGSVTAEHGIFAKAAIRSADIAEASIGEAHIDKASINTAHIQDAAIDNAKIKDLAVNSAKIEELSVDKLSPDEINGKRISADLINVEELIASTAAIETLYSQFANFYNINTINAVINNANISWAQIEKAIVTDIQIDEAIVEKIIVDDLWVTSANIGDAVINNAHIEDGAITNLKVADASITNAKIEDATIEHGKINSLDANKITTGLVNAQFIDVDSLVAESALITELRARSADFVTTEAISANIGELDAGIITAGTLSVERLVFINKDNPEDSLLFALNKSSSVIESDTAPTDVYEGLIWYDTVNLVYKRYDSAIEDWVLTSDITSMISSEQIDGRSIAPKTIYGDRIISKSVTAEEIFVADLSSLSIDAGVIEAGRLQSENNTSFFDLNEEELVLGRQFQYRTLPNGDKTLTLIDVDINFLHGSDMPVSEFGSRSQFPNENLILELNNREEFPHPAYIVEYDPLVEVGDPELFYYNSATQEYLVYRDEYVVYIGAFDESYNYKDLETNTYYYYREPIYPISLYDSEVVGENFHYYYDPTTDQYYEYDDGYVLVSEVLIYISDDTRFDEDRLYYATEENRYYRFNGSTYIQNTLSQEISKISTLASGALQLSVFGDNPQEYTENLAKIFDFTTDGLYISDPNQNLQDTNVKLRLDSDDISFISKDISKETVLARFQTDKMIVESIDIRRGEIEDSLTIGNLKIQSRQEGEVNSMDFLWIGG